MNRSAFVASLAAASVRLPGLASATDERRFPPAQLQSDLDQLWNAMLAVGAYPFATSNREAVTARYRAVRAALRRPLDTFSFALEISTVFGALNDGHVAIEPGDAYMSALAVPLGCTVVGGEVIVLASGGDAVEPGSTLLGVANIPAERIRDVTLAGWGGQTPRLRIERFASASRLVMSMLAGAPAAYDVRWRTPAGAERRTTLAPGTVTMPWSRAANASYSFRTIAGGTVGLIDYRRCVGPASFQSFLQRAFSTVRDSGIRAVIVDIRHNSGGDSDLNNDLWGYLTTKTFTQFGPIVMRSSDYLKKRYGKAKYVEIYGSETWNAPTGNFITYPQAKIGFITPRPNPLRFKGPVALLIGPRTFSSALDCANAAKAYGLATLIGEETSEPTNTTGEVIRLPTRFTGVTGSFTTKYFMPPKAAPPGRGVIPDIEVQTTLDDVLAGRDPVLARAIHELRIREERRQTPPHSVETRPR